MAIDTKSVSQLIAEFQKLQAKDAITPGRYRGQVNVLIYAAACYPSGHGPVPSRVSDSIHHILNVFLLN